MHRMRRETWMVCYTIAVLVSHEYNASVQSWVYEQRYVVDSDKRYETL